MTDTLDDAKLQALEKQLQNVSYGGFGEEAWVYCDPDPGDDDEAEGGRLSDRDGPFA
ncbi:hypothetical protein LCGC14_3047010, partial [marine sediment metagenome]